MPGFDLGAAVIAARQAGILALGGGHAMAAGFSLAAARIAEFGAFLGERFAACGIAAGRVPELGIDGSMALSGLDVALVARLEGLGPFGAGMSEPRSRSAICASCAPIPRARAMSAVSWRRRRASG